jgi:hypothetical protein
MTLTDVTIHRLLVEALASAITWDEGTVLKAEGVGTLSKPDEIEGLQPDVLAKSSDGTMIIGEAKSFHGRENARSEDFATALRTFGEWAVNRTAPCD